MKNIDNSIVIHEIEKTFTSIQTHHPEIRPALFSIHNGYSKRERGHYQENSWRSIKNKSKIDDITIMSNIIKEGAESILEILLHEACHSLATTRNIKDTSRNGRYHNAKFEKIAIELGLKTKKHNTFGYITTNIEEKTKMTYKRQLYRLSIVLQHYQLIPETNKKEKSRLIKATCSCERIIRLSHKTYKEGEIICNICNTIFEAY